MTTAVARRRNAAGLGKISTTSARRLISLFNRSMGLFDQIFCQWALGNAVNASTSVLASASMVATFGNDPAKVSATRSHWAATSTGSVWAKIVLTAAVTAGACLADTAVCRLRMKCTRQTPTVKHRGEETHLSAHGEEPHDELVGGLKDVADQAVAIRSVALVCLAGSYGTLSVQQRHKMRIHRAEIPRSAR